VHPAEIVVDIVGIRRGDCGRSCSEHEVCGLAVLREDVLVCICKEQVLVPDVPIAGKARMKEETELTVNLVSNGIDSCRVGFLPQEYVAQGKLWDGVLCQVVSDGHYCGYACVAVVLDIPVGVKEIPDKRWEFIVSGKGL
jgi:hypothetical protein